MPRVDTGSIDPAAELKDIIGTARKRSLNFALLKAKEGVILKAHPLKSVDVLFRDGKQSGGLPTASAMGTMNVAGKVMELTVLTDDVPQLLATLAKKHFSSLGIKVKVVFLLPSGARLETAEEEDAEEEEKKEAPTTDAANLPPPDPVLVQLRAQLAAEFAALDSALARIAARGAEPVARKVEQIAALFPTENARNPRKAAGLLALLTKTIEAAGFGEDEVEANQHEDAANVGVSPDKGGGSPRRDLGPKPGEKIDSDCVPIKGHVPGPVEHQLCRTHGHVIDVRTGVVLARSLADYQRAKASGSIDPAPRATRGTTMADDCVPVASHVPGPKNHQLCKTHGHVLDVDARIVLARTLKEYLRLKDEGKLGDPTPDNDDEDEEEDDDQPFTDTDRYFAFLQKWVTRLKRGQAIFALGLTDDTPEGLRFNFHRTKEGKQLALQLRQEADATRTTFGKAAAGGASDEFDSDAGNAQTLLLMIEGRMIPQLAKLARKSLIAVGISAFRKVVIIEDGVEVESDSDDDEPPTEEDGKPHLALEFQRDTDLDGDDLPILSKGRANVGDAQVQALVGSPGETPVTGPDTPKDDSAGKPRKITRKVRLVRGDTPRSVMVRAVMEHFKLDQEGAERMVSFGKIKEFRKVDFSKEFALVQLEDSRRRDADPETLSRVNEKVKGLPAERRKVIEAQADALFKEQTGFASRPNEQSPELFAQWQQSRVEATQMFEIAELPDHVKSVLRFAADGVEVEPKNFQRILDIADALQDLSPEKVRDFNNRSNSSTTDVGKYLNSVEAYIAKVRQEEETGRTMVRSEDKLLGTKELYELFKKSREPIDKDLGNRDEVLLAQVLLPAALKKAGFTEKEFEDAIRQYKENFQAQAVSQANQAMDRREHDIFQLKNEAVQDAKMPAAMTALGGLFEARQQSMERHSKPGVDNNDKVDMNAVRNDLRPMLEQAAKSEPTLRQLLDFSRQEDSEGKARISDDFVDMLTTAQSPQHLKQMLDTALKDRKDAIGKTRETLKEDPEKIWGFDKAIAKTKADARLDPAGAPAEIISDKQTEMTLKKIAIAVGLGAAAVVAGMLSGGTGAVAIAAAAVDLGVAGYGAYTAVLEYQQENAAHLAGLSSTSPSLAWAVVAVVTLPLQVLTLGSAIARSARFLQLSDAAKKAEVIAELLSKDTAAAKTLGKFNENCVKIKGPDDAKKLVADLQKQLKLDLQDKSAEIIAAIIARATEEASVFQSFVESSAVLGSVDPHGAVALLAKQVATATYRCAERGCTSLQSFLREREFVALGLTLEAIEKDPVAARNLAAAIEMAQRDAKPLRDAAKALELTDTDIESVSRFWARNPELTAEEVADQMPVLKEARTSLGDLSKLPNVNGAYAEKLAEAERISATFRRLKMSPEDIKAALQYRKRFPDAPIDEFLDSIQFFKSHEIRPSGNLGSPSQVLRTQSPVAPRTPPINHSSPTNTSKAARRTNATNQITDDDSRQVLQSIGQSDEVAGTGGITKMDAEAVAGDPGAVKVTIEGDPAAGALQRDTKKPLSSGQRYAPSFNGDGPPLASLQVRNASEVATLRDGAWQRLHLWGPGFGDEAKAGMFIGPSEFNLAWQNSGIEDLIRELSRQVAPHAADGFRFRVRASASSWGRPTPGGLFLDTSSELFLKDVKYELELFVPGSTKPKVATFEMSLLTDPAEIQRGSKAAVHVGFDEAAVNALFEQLP